MKKSKEVKAIILIFALVLFTPTFSLSQEEGLKGDFGVQNSSQIHKMEFKMIAISMTFEGLNIAKAPQIQYNRISEIQNGNLWKYFTGNSNYQSGNIFYHYALDSLSNAQYALDLGHACGIEFPESNLNGVWGFALYKINVEMTNL